MLDMLYARYAHGFGKKSLLAFYPRLSCLYDFCTFVFINLLCLYDFGYSGRWTWTPFFILLTSLLPAPFLRLLCLLCGYFISFGDLFFLFFIFFWFTGQDISRVVFSLCFCYIFLFWYQRSACISLNGFFFS